MASNISIPEQLKLYCWISAIVWSQAACSKKDTLEI